MGRELFKLNSDNEIDILSTPIFYNVNDMTPEFFLANYKNILWQYVADGRASYETMRKYFVNIDQFLNWCVAININPFLLQEAHIIQYRSILYQKGYKQASVNVKLSSIRKFYVVAKKMNLIKINIAADVHGKIPYDEQLTTKYLTLEELQHIINCIPRDKGVVYYKRMACLIAMMGKEGLRRNETRLMSWEDIDERINRILIRGKGHNRYIYPGNDTMEQLMSYKEELFCDYKLTKDKYGTPCFIGFSNVSHNQRLTSIGLSVLTKNILRKAGIDRDGISCHIFRHTFAVLLYAATKDLRLVQAKMGHADPKITSRYAESVDNMTKRFDDAIPVEFES